MTMPQVLCQLLPRQQCYDKVVITMPALMTYMNKVVTRLFLGDNAMTRLS